MTKEKAIIVMVISSIVTTGRPASLAGEDHRLTLQETIERARQNSVEAQQALTELRAAYWQYRAHKADLLPEVSLSATLPSYSKQYNAYQAADGSYTFVRSNYLETTGAINATQRIWQTGGTLTLSSSIDYLRQYGEDGGRRYMAIPLRLTLSQRLFGVNDVKWARRIEPFRYREAKANYLAATEGVTIQAVNLYFNLLLSKENLSMARQNYQNAQRLYDVALAKREMGIISDNDVLQMRLNLLQAESALTDGQTAVSSSRFRLATFLNLTDSVDIDTVVPELAMTADVSYPLALQKAMENNSLQRRLHRQRMEADYSVASARSNQRSVNVYVSVGYTGQDRRWRGAYSPLNEHQRVEVGMSIPLLDWGRRKGRIRMAENNRQTLRSQLEQQEKTFEQNLFILVEQLNNQARQLRIANEADSIARRRYDTNVKTFVAGTISTLELNDAQNSKDAARRQRIQQMYEFWNLYYELRSITLWDFEKNTYIDADFEALIEK
ncbi:MAG: TolC family protein [Prevotella sp.]|nr:TolC family protein [Prevotella sp.]